DGFGRLRFALFFRGEAFADAVRVHGEDRGRAGIVLAPDHFLHYGALRRLRARALHQLHEHEIAIGRAGEMFGRDQEIVARLAVGGFDASPRHRAAPRVLRGAIDTEDAVGALPQPFDHARFGAVVGLDDAREHAVADTDRGLAAHGARFAGREANGGT